MELGGRVGQRVQVLTIAAANEGCCVNGRSSRKPATTGEVGSGDNSAETKYVRRWPNRRED